MPIYTYVCRECGLAAEKILAIAERDSASCDECGGNLKRNMDRPGSVYAPTSTGGFNR
jgi:putative FmdB family regulatory protein